MTPWSVRPRAGCSKAAARSARASILQAPSSSEYSEWTCRWAQAGVLTAAAILGVRSDGAAGAVLVRFGVSGDPGGPGPGSVQRGARAAARGGAAGPPAGAAGDERGERAGRAGHAEVGVGRRRGPGRLGLDAGEAAAELDAEGAVAVDLERVGERAAQQRSLGGQQAGDQ